MQNLPLIKIDKKTVDIDYDTVYKKYFENQKRFAKELAEKGKKVDKHKVIHFEVFTFVLSNKLWKINAYFQNKREYIYKEEEEEINKEFMQKTKTYIKEYLAILQEFYDEKINIYTLYLSLNKIDKKFIADFVFEEILDDIQEQPDVEKSNIPEGKFFKQIQPLYEDISSILSATIQNKKYKKYKFYRILEKIGKNGLDIDKVCLFIDAYFDKILKSEKNNLQNVEFLGILRSGSFLSNALNILKTYQQQEKNNYVETRMLLTHPFLTLLPRKVFTSENKTIYIDEAIKSGYSLMIADKYREKLLKLKKIDKDKNDKAFVVSDFIDYEKSFSTIDYESLCEVEIDKAEHKLKFKPFIYELSRRFDWRDFLEKMDISKLTDNLKNVCKIQNRIDLTMALSDSFLLFGVAKYFAVKLKEKITPKITNQEKIVFFSGSSEGKLLVDTTVFVYHLLYDDAIVFKLEGKDVRNIVEKDYKVFIDISIVSGYTLNFVKQFDFQNNANFDSIFVIYNATDETHTNENNIVDIVKRNDFADA